MKYAIQFRDKTLPITEDEVPKVVQAMDEKRIVVLQCGILNGAFISGIVRDLHGERGYKYGFDISGETSRKDYICDFGNALKAIENNPKLLLS